MPRTSKEYIQMAKDALRGKMTKSTLKYVGGSLLIYLLIFVILFAATLIAIIPVVTSAIGRLPVSGLSSEAIIAAAIRNSIWPSFLAMAFVYILMFSLFSYYYVGTSQFILRLLQGETPTIGDMFAGFRRPLHSAGNCLLYYLRTMLPMIVCIPALFLIMLPFIDAGPAAAIIFCILAIAITVYVLSIALLYGNCFLLQCIHPEMKIRELHRRSKRAMKGNRWKLIKLELRMWYLILPYCLLFSGASFCAEANHPGLYIALMILALVYILPVGLFMGTALYAFAYDLDKQLDPPAETGEDIPLPTSSDTDSPNTDCTAVE